MVPHLATDDRNVPATELRLDIPVLVDPLRESQVLPQKACGPGRRGSHGVGSERKSSDDEMIWFCLPVIAGTESGMTGHSQSSSLATVTGQGGLLHCIWLL